MSAFCSNSGWKGKKKVHIKPSISFTQFDFWQLSYQHDAYFCVCSQIFLLGQSLAINVAGKNIHIY